MGRELYGGKSVEVYIVDSLTGMVWRPTRVLTKVGNRIYALTDNPQYKERKLGYDMFFCKEEALIVAESILRDYVIPREKRMLLELKRKIAELEDTLDVYTTELYGDSSDFVDKTSPQLSQFKWIDAHGKGHYPESMPYGLLMFAMVQLWRAYAPADIQFSGDAGAPATTAHDVLYVQTAAARLWAELQIRTLPEYMCTYTRHIHMDEFTDALKQLEPEHMDFYFKE